MGPVPVMASKPQEIDVLENWEELEEVDVLEQKFNDLITPGKCIADERTNGNLNEKPVQIILTGDDALRTQYVPPEPTVKILKRPNKNAQNTTNSKNFQPKKTLEQREQAYAEARLRILGEAQSEKTDEKISIVKPDLKVKPSESDNVIRLPKGPDGTKGFKLRR